ncbi:hypothetical protein, partial [Thermocatellispora tengchongensis]|uniref:hypothetical protein n=1 Tax=Thermocatellispora tengchongensis TaxID=1073253 RepID=UPI0031EF48F1
MASIVYAAPYIPPAPEPSPWAGIGMTWTGWDGSIWDLTTRASGLYLRRGVRGLGAPEHERRFSVSPGIPGSRHKGHRIVDREVFWPVRLWHDKSSVGFVQRDGAFWRTMDPDQPGVWTVDVPGTGRRYLDCRFDAEEAGSFDLNPVRQGWADYGIRMLADRPLFYGDVRRRTWAEPEEQNFFGGSVGFGPPFIIGSGSNTGTASIDNPGDVPAYPAWTVT